MEDERKEGFLSRWSRLKTGAEQTEADAPPAPVPAAPAPAPEEDGSDGDDDAFDPASLPSLDSLDRDSDYSAFLHRKVPDALRNAALRKAWSSDPKITGYKPLVEYDWDCNAPGYAALRDTDDAAKVVAAMFRHLMPKEEEEQEEEEVRAEKEPSGGDEAADEGDDRVL